jgi:catechol 2,3-dioxygenase-like lactoylglutathione lyase family enzyme
MPADAAMVLRVDHVQLAIPAGAENACRAFFVGVLGLREIEKPAALAARGGLWLRSGDAELHLGVERDFKPAQKAHPGFAVTDIVALAARVADAGHEVRWAEASEIPGRRRFFTDDPVGNRLEFLADESTR